ncbi:hypothetical protein BKA70DRAFT_1404568 [Coprinopsis sp. MPI-PUGE-AT-0042]|nr:hypothetical protein BKA70DRAFT_1404568 [Coprinopsis sp. MPI-PUGE-AT-0042]
MSFNGFCKFFFFESHTAQCPHPSDTLILLSFLPVATYKRRGRPPLSAREVMGIRLRGSRTSRLKHCGWRAMDRTRVTGGNDSASELKSSQTVAEEAYLSRYRETSRWRDLPPKARYEALAGRNWWGQRTTALDIKKTRIHLARPESPYRRMYKSADFITINGLGRQKLRETDLRLGEYTSQRRLTCRDQQFVRRLPMESRDLSTHRRTSQRQLCKAKREHQDPLDTRERKNNEWQDAIRNEVKESEQEPVALSQTTLLSLVAAHQFQATLPGTFVIVCGREDGNCLTIFAWNRCTSPAKSGSECIKGPSHPVESATTSPVRCRDTK